MNGCIRWRWLVLACLVAMSGFRPGAAQAEMADVNLVQTAAPLPGALLVQLNEGAMAEARRAPRPFIVRSFPLTAVHSVDLELERFTVLGPETVFIAAGDDGDGQAVAVDWESYAFFRGRVLGRAGSSVYLSIGPRGGVGRIELGPGAPTFLLSSVAPGGLRMPAGQYTVFPGRVLAAPASLVPRCATIHTPAERSEHSGDVPAPLLRGGDGADGSHPIRGLRQAKLSVEADFEFYSLFNDEQATIDYLIQLYGAVSGIFIRETRLRVDIVFMRVWTTPNDPWGNSVGFPPAPPGGIPWNVAQLISGRRDASAGGMASGQYSWVAYGQGYFGTPDGPHINNQDLEIVAHELGHNVGAPHTHDIGIDLCHIATSPARRGTIMSYCSQTFSGGVAVMDMGFHTSIRNVIRNYINPRPAFIFDCNQNRIADNLDIQSGFSQDLNSNGIPDECEDCNNNGILDSIDIQTGFSRDLNNNGIPDECEPDCNNNGVPDDRDILLGTSQDLNFNGIPDECETDCNSNGISDYLEIMANMALDIDRNAVLDACQDCDNNGVPDLVALQGANNAWVATIGGGALRQYHAVTGVLMSTTTGQLSQPQDLIITRDGRILVSSAGNHRIVEFDRHGAHVRDLIAGAAGGLIFPTGLLMLPDGSLLVCSRNTHSVRRFNSITGAFLGEFVTPGSGGLLNPHGIALGLNGNVYVAAGNNRILEFHRVSGAYVRELVGPTGNGGLSDPRGILFTYDPPRLIVASRANNRVLEYDPYTGAYRKIFNNGDYVGKLVGPWGVRLGPNGDVFVSRSSGTRSAELHLTNPYIFQFDGRNGNLVRAYVQGLDSQAVGSGGFDFMPGEGLDCNWNQIPDWCDIASGYSRDLNNNGIPDECEECYADCDKSGSLNVEDFACFINLFAAGDLRANCDHSTAEPVLNVEDFACFLNRFAAGCL
jgi:hypothetical protein